MKQLDKTIGVYSVTVYGPTALRQTWRVNLMDIDDGGQACAFFANENDALAQVNALADGIVPSWAVFA